MTVDISGVTHPQLGTLPAGNQPTPDNNDIWHGIVSGVKKVFHGTVGQENTPADLPNPNPTTPGSLSDRQISQVTPSGPAAPAERFKHEWQRVGIALANDKIRELVEVIFAQDVKPELASVKTAGAALASAIELAKLVPDFFRVVKKLSESIIAKKDAETPWSLEFVQTLGWLTKGIADPTAFRREVVEKVQRNRDIEKKYVVPHVIDWLLLPERSDVLRSYLERRGMHQNGLMDLNALLPPERLTLRAYLATKGIHQNALMDFELKTILEASLKSLLEAKFDRFKGHLEGLMHNFDDIVLRSMQEKSKKIADMQLAQLADIMEEMDLKTLTDQSTLILVEHMDAYLAGRKRGTEALRRFENDENRKNAVKKAKQWAGLPADAQLTVKEQEQKAKAETYLREDYPRQKLEVYRKGFSEGFKEAKGEDGKALCHPTVQAILNGQPDVEQNYFAAKIEEVLKLADFPETDEQLRSWTDMLADLPPEITEVKEALDRFVKEATCPEIHGLLQTVNSALFSFLDSPETLETIRKYSRSMVKDLLLKKVTEKVTRYTNHDVLAERYVNKVLPQKYAMLVQQFADLAMQRNLGRLSPLLMNFTAENKKACLDFLYEQTVKMSKHVNLEQIGIDRAKFDEIMDPVLADIHGHIEKLRAEHKGPASSFTPKVVHKNLVEVYFKSKSIESVNASSSPIMTRLVLNLKEMIEVPKLNFIKIIIGWFASLIGKQLNGLVTVMTKSPDALMAKVATVTRTVLTKTMIHDLYTGEGNRAKAFLLREREILTAEVLAIEKKPSLSQADLNRLEAIRIKMDEYQVKFGELSALHSKEEKTASELAQIEDIEERLANEEHDIYSRKRDEGFKTCSLLIDDYLKSKSEDGIIETIIYWLIPSAGTIEAAMGDIFAKFVGNQVLTKNFLYRVTDYGIRTFIEKKEIVQSRKVSAHTLSGA